MEAAAIHHESLMKTNGCSWAPLKTLYIGGGTPSLWGKEGAPFLKDLLNKHNITLTPDCEFTLEVNPGSWDKESLEMWESLGVNRFSLGIQSLQKEAIKYLDRVHSIEELKYEVFQQNIKKILSGKWNTIVVGRSGKS
jgi:oxygen-independent coproporphyrinogen-3 oxidase